MIENVLTRKNAATKTKITVKALVSVAIVALAVALPQLVHFTLGAAAGAKWLPMYLPIILGGCLLGSRYGLMLGMISPVVSFLMTSIQGTAMPSLERLPFMMAELAVMGFICGLFSKKIDENSLIVFPAVITAQVISRAFFLALAAVLGSFSTLTVSAVLTQIQTGIVGMAAQALLVPTIILVLKKIMTKGNAHD